MYNADDEKEMATAFEDLKAIFEKLQSYPEYIKMGTLTYLAVAILLEREGNPLELVADFASRVHQGMITRSKGLIRESDKQAVVVNRMCPYCDVSMPLKGVPPDSTNPISVTVCACCAQIVLMNGPDMEPYRPEQSELDAMYAAQPGLESDLASLQDYVRNLDRTGDESGGVR